MRALSLVILALLFTSVAHAAGAECYADYKAKKDDPLQLQYGVAKITGNCSVEAAREELVPRLAVDGWQLLEVMDTFDESGLEGRRASAGDYFLRY